MSQIGAWMASATALVAGPMRREKGLLFAEVESARAGVAKRALDVAGHYSRPGIFTLRVNTRSQSPVEFDQAVVNSPGRVAE